MTFTRDMSKELGRTRPDYVVYVPGSFDGSSGDTGNEHFHVFDGPDGSLVAVWTQSTYEGRTDQKIVMSRSLNGGCSWSSPTTVAGGNADPETGTRMCSWQVVMVSDKGRIYVLYNRHIGRNDVFSHTTGLMAGVWSDDLGRTWSPEEFISMPRTCWDHPDPSMPANWIVWQRPERLSQGKHLVGFTRWLTADRNVPRPQYWWGYQTVVSFFRVENLDAHPPVSGLNLTYFHEGSNALKAPFPGNPNQTVIQEPSLVKLPDGRLFNVMRSPSGSPWWSVSADQGETWSEPQPLCYSDSGPLVAHPCSPCPIYEHATGGYIFLYHNHDGHFGPYGPGQTLMHRRPTYMLRGQFVPGARQPVWFSDPKFFMDNDGVCLGHGSGRVDLAMYASVTHKADVTTLW